jgi:hypothetical protein
MALANPLWGAPRIHGELLEFELDVSQRGVTRLMPPPGRALQRDRFTDRRLDRAATRRGVPQ